MTLVWIKQIWLLVVCGEDNAALQQKVNVPISNIKNANVRISVHPDTFLKYVGKLHVLLVAWHNITKRINSGNSSYCW
jgi:hypothetical protein